MRHCKNSFRYALMTLLCGVMLCTSCKKDSGATGDCTWALTGSPGKYTLTVGGRGAMGDYASPDESPWRQYRDGIKTVVIRNGVTTVGACAFIDCGGLTSVSIPNSVTTIGEMAFGHCNRLASVSIPNSVTTIGTGAFWGCRGLTSVTIPNSVTTIGIGAFAGCTDLISVTIPNSVTTIGMGAFAQCDSLTSVSIPNSVKKIGDEAFSGCNNLTSVTSLNPTPQNISSNVFADVNIADCVLKVPASAVDAYKAAPVWKGFGKITAVSGEEERE